MATTNTYEQLHPYKVNRETQKELVRQLCDNIARYINTRIDDEKIPDTWDGHELRELVSDIASENRSLIMTKSRRKDYKNTRLVEGF